MGRPLRTTNNFLQELAERGGQVRAAQGVFDVGFEEAQFVAYVVAFAFKAVGIDGFAAGHGLQGVGELDFPALARLGMGQDFKDVRRDDIAAQDGRPARCFFDGRLFDDAVDFQDVLPFDRRPLDDAV